MNTTTLDPLQTSWSTITAAPTSLDAYFLVYGQGMPDLPDPEESQPGFVHRARALAERTPTPSAIARLAKAEFDAGNRVSTCTAVGQLLTHDERVVDVAAITVATEVAIGCGDFALAEQLIEKVDSTRSATLAILAASLAARRGDLDQAATLLTSLPTQSPESLEFQAMLALQADNRHRAIGLLRAAIRSEAHTPNAYVNLAYAYGAVGSPAKALRAARVGFSLAPTSKAAGVNLAASLETLGYSEEAIKTVRELWQLYPVDLHLHFAYAELIANTGAVGKALDHVSRLRTEPWFDDVDNTLRAEFDAFVATLRWRAGRITRAAAFDKILKAFARSDYSSEPTARQLAQVAGELRQRDDVEAAIVRATGKCANRTLHALRVQAKLMSDDAIEEAVEVIETWAQEDPSDSGVWAMGSYTEILAFRFDRAARWARDGLRRFPNDVMLANNLAFALALDGQPAAARHALPDAADHITVRATEAAISIAEGNVAEGQRQYVRLSEQVRHTDPETADLIELYRRFTTAVLTGRISEADNPPPNARPTITSSRVLTALQSLAVRHRSTHA